MRSRLAALALLLAAPLTAAAAASSASPQPSTAPVTAITGTTIVHPSRDGAGALEPGATVVLRGDRIEYAGPARGAKLRAGATVIDGRGKFVIPGLVDSHVHFFQSGNLYTRPDVADFNAVVPYAQEVARNKARLDATFKVWLANGVTGVADVGGPFWNFDVRDRARATAAAPRMVVAGPLISMVDRPQLNLGDPPIIRIDSPDAARTLVARELERDPDFIKVWFIHRPGDDLAAQEAIVKAAGDAAHAAGKRLAVHATELVPAKAALRAGADLLVHSVFDAPVDDEFIALMRKNGALYCPTLFVMQGYLLALSGQWQATPEEQRGADPVILAAMGDLAKLPPEKVPERVAKLMAAKKPVEPPTIAKANLRKLEEAGIPVVMGTDAGNIGTLHGPSVFREMRMMAQSGLTPLQVLRSATTTAARTMGLEDRSGEVTSGKLADLVILDANPLEDVGNLAKVHRTIKGGVVYDPRELMQSIAPATGP
jgi:imidazolonepropionase-like amidohydrolase